MDGHLEVECVYGQSKHVMFHPKFGERFIRNLPAEWPLPVLNASLTPGWRIDGGQMMIRRSALERIPYPYYPEGHETARVCDAHYMDKLVQYLAMQPVQTLVMINRMTPLSSHVVPDALGRETVVDWRRLK